MTLRLSRAGRRTAALLGAGVAVAAVAASLISSSSGSHAQGPVRGPSASASGGTGAPRSSVTPSAPRATFSRVREPGVADTQPRGTLPAVSAPVRLRIPAIGVDTSLERLHVMRDRTLQTPVDYARAGWFAEGPEPGQVGPAVVAGHIDSTSGPAVFFRLGKLRRGDTVQVTLRDTRVVTFVVDTMQRFAKKDFPTDTVYGPTPDPQLRLITCTGRFDASVRSYVDNLVVSAHLR